MNARRALGALFDGWSRILLFGSPPRPPVEVRPEQWLAEIEARALGDRAEGGRG